MRIRPSDKLSLLARYYWKPALDSPTKLDGKRDLREDFEFEIDLKASEKITLTWSADWHSDDVPPVADLAPDALGQDVTQQLRAFDKHWVYDMSVKVTL